MPNVLCILTRDEDIPQVFLVDGAKPQATFTHPHFRATLFAIEAAEAQDVESSVIKGTRLKQLCSNASTFAFTNLVMSASYHLDDMPISEIDELIALATKIFTNVKDVRLKALEKPNEISPI